MPTNYKLKGAIFDKGFKQQTFAEIVGVSEMVLSRFITGRQVPTVELRRKIAKILSRDEADLFPISTQQTENQKLSPKRNTDETE